MIGEVGQTKTDMILVVDLGGTLPVNFWWPCYEGSHVISRASHCDGANPPLPFVEVEHGISNAGYLVGGTIYRKSGSKYEGYYVFMISQYPADYTSYIVVNLDTREIYRFVDLNESRDRIVFGFAENSEGELLGLLDYYLSSRAREDDAGIYKLTFLD